MPTRFAMLALLLALLATARAQAVQRCLQVQTGQTVVLGPDLESHLLAAQGGDTPSQAVPPRLPPLPYHPGW